MLGGQGGGGNGEGGDDGGDGGGAGGGDITHAVGMPALHLFESPTSM